MAEQPSGFGRSKTRNVVRLVLDESAQTMTEYAVVLTLITLAVVAAVTSLSDSVASHITDLANLIK